MGRKGGLRGELIYKLEATYLVHVKIQLYSRRDFSTCCCFYPENHSDLIGGYAPLTRCEIDQL